MSKKLINILIIGLIIFVVLVVVLVKNKDIEIDSIDSGVGDSADSQNDSQQTNYRELCKNQSSLIRSLKILS